MYMNNLEEPTGLNFADKTRYKSEVLTGHTTWLLAEVRMARIVIKLEPLSDNWVVTRKDV